MDILTRQENSVAIISITGEISFKQIAALQEEIQQILQNSLNGLILDLTRTTYIDSAGLSILMRCHAHMVRGRGKFIVVGVTGAVERVLKMMKLDTVLTLVHTLEDAKAKIA